MKNTLHINVLKDGVCIWQAKKDQIRNDKIAKKKKDIG
jgi:hypothetical protein